MLDFKALGEKKITLAELTAGLEKSDLHRLTDEMIDTQLAILTDVDDGAVTFVPVDEKANDRFAADSNDVNLAWTLGHIVVHVTSSSEESAALASSLARGVPVKERSRWELAWQTVSRVAELRARLEESRRMRHAFLETWPDQPHLDLVYTPWPGAPEINAVGRFVLGLSHDDAHLEQMREILRQYRSRSS